MPFKSPAPGFRSQQSPPLGLDPQVVVPVPPQQWPAASDPVWSLVGIDRAQAEQFASSLDGFIYFPGLPDYLKARAGEPEWPTPRIIAYCHSQADVGKCLDFVKQHEWLVSIRSGGHNSAGYHLCNGLVIDVGALDDVTVDTSTSRVKVGPGVMFEKLDASLQHSEMAVPGGTCANVCCAGYYMGGGYSLASRTFGMGCDSVVSATVMLASGETVTATPQSHPDLFWALMGGSGGQFGILLELELEGHQPDAFWGFLAQWDLADAAAVLGHLESAHTLGENPAPEKFGYLAVISHLVEGDPVSTQGKGKVSPDPKVAVLGMYHGTKAEGTAELSQLFAIGSPQLRYDKETRYSVINTELFLYLPYVALDLGQALSVSSSGLVGPSGSPDWGALAHQMQHSTNPGNLIAFEPYGGAIAAAPPGRTSYPHRGQKLDMLFDSFWNPQWSGTYTSTRADAEHWLEETLAVVAPALSGRTYVNYADRKLADYRKQYWAESFDRLLDVKRSVDPDEVFRFDQSISWVPGVGDPPHP